MAAADGGGHGPQLVGVSAAKADTGTEQLSEYESPVVKPLERAGEGAQVTGVGGDA
jgi:hypothetical protein